MVSPRSSRGPERPYTIRRIQGTVLETWTVKKGIREWSEMEENGTLSHLDFTVLESMRLLFQRFYLFIEKEEKGGRKRGRETSVCGCLSCTYHWGPGPQPRHVP